MYYIIKIENYKGFSCSFVEQNTSVLNKECAVFYRRQSKEILQEILQRTN